MGGPRAWNGLHRPHEDAVHNIPKPSLRGVVVAKQVGIKKTQLVAHRSSELLKPSLHAVYGSVMPNTCGNSGVQEGNKAVERVETRVCQTGGPTAIDSPQTGWSRSHLTDDPNLARPGKTPIPT